MKTKNLIYSLLMGMAGGLLLFGVMMIFTDNDVAEVCESAMVDTVDTLSSEQRLATERTAATVPVSLGSRMSAAAVPDFTMAAENGVNAVVHIKTRYNQPSYTLYDFIFGTQPQYSTPVMASGSGVIISTDGYIVTNNHVIENAEIIEVVLNNKKSYTGKLIGRDPSTDIALLKIDDSGLPFLKYGNSDDLRIGEWVLAVGNPFNLTSTVTAGIVSAKARNIDLSSDNMAIESFIQTDAAVNPGNSGGALLSTNGELVGINTAIASRTGSFVGYSFAVPINIVRKVVADIVEFGEVQRAYLGIDMANLDSDIADKLNVEASEGVYVARVWKNSASDKAGIKTGDIIVQINGKTVNSCAEILEQISRFRPGENVSLQIKRNNKMTKKTVVLQNKYGTSELVKSDKIDALGATFEPVSEYDKKRLRITNGIQVTDIVAGKFATNGVQKGFIIIRVNSKNIESTDDLEKIMKNADGGLFIEGIYPNGVTAYYAFKL